MKIIVRGNPTGWKKKALHELRNRISPYIFLQEGQGEGAYKHTLNLGMFIQDAILDQNEGLVIKYVKVENIASYTVNIGDNRFSIEGAARRSVCSAAKHRYSNIIDRAHQALLPSVYQQIVHIPEVNVYLRPLSKILGRVDEQGLVRPTDIKKPARKVEQYITLLSDLDYIMPENGYYVAGKQMKQLKGMLSSTSLYNRILADVIEARPKYIHNVLRLPMITTYLKWANAYYFPSYRVSHLIRLSKDDYIEEYNRFYGYRYDPAQINRLQEVSIIKKLQGDHGIVYEGHQETLDDFTEKAEAQKIMEPPITR